MALKTAAIREALAAVLDDAGIRAYGYFSDAPQPPCAVVQFPASVTPAAFADEWDYLIPVQVMVQRVTDARSQDALDVLVSRVVDLIEGATVSGGSVTIASVDGIGDLGADQPMTVATINLVVRA